MEEQTAICQGPDGERKQNSRALPTLPLRPLTVLGTGPVSWTDIVNNLRSKAWVLFHFTSWQGQGLWQLKGDLLTRTYPERMTRAIGVTNRFRSTNTQ